MAPPSPTPSTAERSPVISALMYGLGIALIGGAATNMLHQPQLLIPVLAAAIAVAVIGSLIGTWHRQRRRPVRDLTTALAPVLRVDSTDGMLKARRRRHGVPTRLTIKYPAVFDERDEKARAEIRDIIATRLGGDVEATWQPPKRRVIVTIDPTPGATDIHDSSKATAPVASSDTEAQALVRARATEVVQAIMGATSRITQIDFDGGTDAPVALHVSYATTSRDLNAVYRQKVLLQVDSKTPGTWRDIWDFENSRVRFELRPPFPRNVPYPVQHPREYGVLPYAAGANGEIISWKLGAKRPHFLVVGPTGSGKTVLIRDIVLSAVLQGIPVILCDPKRTEYLDFAHFPGVILVTDIADIADAIQRFHDLMEERYAEIEAGLIASGAHSKFLFILDEYAVFKKLVNKLWEDKKKEQEKPPKRTTHPCLDDWSNLVLMVRGAGGHLVQGLQRPDADVTGGAERDSFRQRLALDQHTPETAKMMWNNSRIGTDLPSVQGRAMADTGRTNHPEEVQVLRMIPPSVDGHTEEDAWIWEHAREQASNPELWKEVYIPDALLELKARREQRMAVQRARLGIRPGAEAPAEPVSLAKASTSADASEPADAPDDATPPSPGRSEEDQDVQRLEDVGLYELEVGDVVMLEDETGIPCICTIDDIDYSEGDDGEELVDLTYTTEEGEQEVRTFSTDQSLTRRTKTG
ncbi:FtsK/SpoIIIE domain-containing protein [Streptantibioticus ferralitis]|uniref:FtsK/SpoIIIE domain-containing protein n=1 Tax=Streptantibioticus ferralitis TaxID=236510 RepID=A0ABT5ZAS1_9ACTN|nr:FtsK/SpoIIIE domain-containing protein [Streptantibioticus ferralitis]MDF2260945.1 FtsK/SpoIIIE domain-containing protein [Streptantibioticus ferralitis]